MTPIAIFNLGKSARINVIGVEPFSRISIAAKFRIRPNAEEGGITGQVVR